VDAQQPTPDEGQQSEHRLLHPSDAAARSLQDGDRVRVSSRLGSIELPLEVGDGMRPGVV
jgi:anaerobic selenocysteine-containing dehydrogenase